PICQPVLGQLARHADPVGVVVGRQHRGVFQPHVVGPLRQLEPQLFLDLRPDLVLIQLMPPCAFSSPDAARSGHPALWTRAPISGEGSRPGSANAVDNLGPNPFHPSPAPPPATPPGVASRPTAGSTEARRS